MTSLTTKTQDKQDVLQEARKAAALMERLVIQYKDDPNWPEIVAREYKEARKAAALMEQIAANIKKKGIKRITVQMEQTF